MRCHLDLLHKLPGNGLGCQSAKLPQQDPLSCFCSAVLFPTLIALRTSSGTLSRAHWETTSPRTWEHAALSNNGFRCSADMPDGPPAAPLRALLKFFNNKSTSRSKGTEGSASTISRSRGRFVCQRFPRRLGPWRDCLPLGLAWQSTVLPSAPTRVLGPLCVESCQSGHVVDCTLPTCKPALLRP